MEQEVEEGQDDYFIKCLSLEDSKRLEKDLANNAFLYGITYTTDMASELTVMNEQLKTGERKMFYCLRLHTAANRRSVMAEKQYEDYKMEFGLRVPIRACTGKILRGRGRSGKVLARPTYKYHLKPWVLKYTWNLQS